MPPGLSIGIGIGLSQVNPLDEDVRAFFDVTGLTDPIHRTAIRILTSDLKDHETLWGKMDSIHPIVGGNASAHSYNLKDVDLFQAIWINDPTHTSDGVDFNGTNQYGKTGLIPSAIRPGGIHVSVYHRENINNAGYSMGVVSGGRTAYRIRSGSVSALSANSNDTFTLSGAVADSRGFFIGTKEGLTALKSYRNGIIQATGNAGSESNPTKEIYLSCQNVNGSASSFSNKQSAFYSIGDRLTAAEALAFYNIVDTYQTTLGRNV